MLEDLARDGPGSVLAILELLSRMERGGVELS